MVQKLLNFKVQFKLCLLFKSQKLTEMFFTAGWASHRDRQGGSQATSASMSAERPMASLTRRDAKTGAAGAVTAGAGAHGGEATRRSSPNERYGRALREEAN